MSTQEQSSASAGSSIDGVAQPGAPGGPSGEPTEEQLRAAYAAELSRISSTDMVLQAAASLLNIGAYRLGLLGTAEGPAGAGSTAGSERDLEQVRDAIDAVRGLLGVIERSRPQELGPLREALSQLQMAYAREVQAGGAAAAPREPAGEPTAPAGQAGPPTGGPRQAQPQPGAGERSSPGPAESSGRLWVPGR